jgi:hypothetical protein
MVSEPKDPLDIRVAGALDLKSADLCDTPGGIRCFLSTIIYHQITCKRSV